ncbi:unnamed protein product [Vicia faba]|uniref:Uncharacterized protein n=1 Tax=Vicia faba TaxID=3906 RepID=A0AAV1AMA4_VICFA|nr:unnamed protein product [Vicia faba]
MFMKDEEFDKEGVLRRPPPKPPDEMWLNKYETLDMTSSMTSTQKIPLMSLLEILVYCVMKNEHGKAFVFSLKLKKKMLKSKDVIVQKETFVMPHEVEESCMKEVEKLWKKRKKVSKIWNEENQ